MKCPHCNAEIGFQKVCPSCGQRISYGGNTEIYSQAVVGKISVREIFSQTLKRHQRGDAFRSLSRGSLNGANMLSSWQRPWMFLRFFAFMIIISVMFALMVYANPVYSHMLITVGCMVVPLTIMIFIWEMDIHGTVTIFDMALLLMIGGIISLMIASIVNTQLDDMILSGGVVSPNADIAFTAGFTEEPTKLLICIGFLALSRRKFYTLDGLAIGAAVAAGFAFMESIDYVLRLGNKYGMDTGLQVMTMRAVSALSSHISYTAPFVGALCMAMNGERLKPRHFADKTFLIMLAIGVGCHAIHNSNIPDFILIDSMWFYISVKDVILFVILWGALLYMFRCGIRQAISVCETHKAVANINAQAGYAAPAAPAAAPARPAVQPGAALMCISGQYSGHRIPLTENVTLVLGRESSKCNLMFVSDNVSRVHCKLAYYGGMLRVWDLGSSYGTWVNGKKLPANTPAEIRSGDILQIGSGTERFKVV